MMRYGKSFLNHKVHPIATSRFLSPDIYISINLYFPHLVGTSIAERFTVANGRKIPSP